MAVSRTPGAPIASREDLDHDLAALVALDPAFGDLLAATGEVPLRKLAQDYAGLAWVITGQQISVAAGRAIFGRLEEALGTITPDAVMRADDAVLRAAGLSIQKIRTLRACAQAIADGDLDLDALAGMEAEAAVARMSAVRGIGRWTAEVYLLFALGHPDIFPAGDLALRVSAGIAFEGGERPSERDLLARAEKWRPHRSVAARLLWAYYRVAKGGRETAPV